MWRWGILLTVWNENQLMSLFYSYCWISTCFGPTGPSSGEFVQLFTQPLVQYLCRSLRVLCVLSREQSGTETEPMVVWTAVRTLLKMGPVGPKHVEIQQYTNKIVTSVGFHSICWKDARYKKLKIYRQCWPFEVFFSVVVLINNYGTHTLR